jgi:zinc/manganese transport system permease protein
LLAGGEAWVGLLPAGAAGGAPPAAAFLVWTDRRFAAVQEALIGVVFAVAASTEILFLAFDPHGAEHLKDLLVGQILWVAPGDLVPVAVLYALLLAALAFLDLRRRRALFYAVFALAITASVQLVGVYLVFASLIVPALVGGLAAGYAVGVAGYVLGLAASALLDLPTGAAIVCALALAGTGAFVGRGLGRAIAGKASQPARSSSA